jgi:hypothetical protein
MTELDVAGTIFCTEDPFVTTTTLAVTVGVAEGVNVFGAVDDRSISNGEIEADTEEVTVTVIGVGVMVVVVAVTPQQEQALEYFETTEQALAA